MRKAPLITLFWTLALAAPLTALALVGLAFITDHQRSIGQALASVNWRGLALEGSARWPEVAAMVIGQLLILGLLLVRRVRTANSIGA
ncbi:MAG TPA: hypothetical protein VJ123_00610 [Anaerolineales bacterium]|nr:hypothetical protein [Anaerolineales bacterium]